MSKSTFRRIWHQLPGDASLDALMRLLGEIGIHTMVRFDPNRGKNKFTIVITAPDSRVPVVGGTVSEVKRLPDTDDPMQVIRDYIWNDLSLVPRPEDELGEG